MYFPLVIWLILLIIGTILIFKVIHKTLRIILSLLSLILILTLVVGAVSGYFIYKDALDFKDNFGSAEKLFLLEDDGNILSGAIIKNLSSEDNIALTEEQLTFIQTEYKKESLDTIKDEYWRIFIIKSSVFEPENPQDIKGDVLITLIDAHTTSDSLFIFRQYRKDNIVVYPETIIFKTLRVLPISYVENLLEKGVQKAKDKSLELIKKR